MYHQTKRASLMTHSASCAMKLLQFFWTLWKIILRTVQMVCVRNWKQAAYGGFPKQTRIIAHLVKTELRIDSEILRIDPESLEKESEWINFFPLPPLSVHHCPEEFVLGYVIVFMYRPRCNYCIKTFLYDFHVNSNQCIIKIDLWCHICNLWLVSPSAV